MAKNKSPILAAVLSFLIPGFGQVYSGERRKGMGFFLVGTAFTTFEIFLIGNNYRGTELGPIIVAGISIILLWISIVYDAYKSAKEINSQI